VIPGTAEMIAEAVQTTRSRQELPQYLDKAADSYRVTRIQHWDQVSATQLHRRRTGRYYHQRLAEIYRFLCPSGQNVLEVGCGHGDLLAALTPENGVGVDFSPAMIEGAQEKHPHLQFVETDAHHLDLGQTFDTIILSDVVNDLWDVQQVLMRVREHCHPQTRIILNFYSRLWEWPLSTAQSLRLAQANLPQNWLTVEDVSALLCLADFEVIRTRQEVLFPVGVPLVSSLANRYLVKMWPFRLGALTHVLVARPIFSATENKRKKPRVSVIVAARNEAGNIESIFKRTPELGAGTELVFVEGGSSDGTYEVIEETIAAHPERDCKLLKQQGKGKGDAVRLGFANATGEILTILDADLTMPPEELPRYIEMLTSGKADFANGCRLVYPMEAKAMRFLNLVGNKFFSLAFTWLLDQPVKDTLCGTKAMWKSDYDALVANRSYFGDFDPFGDFDLLFGAAKLNLKILDLPIRYRDRTYGETNISRWSHGWLLLKMVIFAARRIKFV
jgi:ubiquinone/menaquinone biosynthesis C-methylase UbiE